MPKSWYDYKSNIPILENSVKEKTTKNGTVFVHQFKDGEKVLMQKEFNMKILANKSPYFMIYRYSHKMSEWKKYKREQDMCCLANFNCTVAELINKTHKSDREAEFIKWFYNRSPISFSNSTMNRICWKVEKAFEQRVRITKDEKKELDSFDYSILTTDSGYDINTYKQVEQVYKQYTEESKQYQQLVKSQNIEKEDKARQRSIFRENFKREVTLRCPNVEMLTNIVVDMCYRKNNGKSKQFAWDVCGEQIIKNLLIKNSNSFSYPVLDVKGDIDFKGKKYSIVTKQISESEIEDEDDN